MNVTRIGLMFLAVLCWNEAYAQIVNRIGLWKLVSYELEFQDTGERQTPFGRT